MYSLKNIRIIGIVCACALVAATSRAVSPPPDGGYPNQNTAEGEDALLSFNLGSANTALGFNALYNATYSLANTAVGSNALFYNQEGHDNTAVGADALLNNTLSGQNTAIGYSALSGESGLANSYNVAVGYRAMALANSSNCTAIGSESLVISSGDENIAVGTNSLFVNTTGEFNTAVGWRSLFNNAEGGSNTVEGNDAMYFNQSGNRNVALGYFALGNNISGDNNIAIGDGAGRNITIGNNNIAIGNGGEAEDFDVIRIGAAHHHATVIAGIANSTLATGLPVTINREGRLGVMTSSRRFKDDIKPMDRSSESILSLQPVTFRYKHDLDPDGIPQFGLVAEQVEKVNPDLVARDEQGKPYTVRYEAVNAMLLNEFLKEHKRVEEQQSAMAEVKTTAAKQATTITDLKSVVTQQQKEIQALTANLKAQATQIQKVSEQQLRTQAPALRVVNN